MYYLKNRYLWIALTIVALAIPTVVLFSQSSVQPVIRKKTIAAFQRLSWSPDSISLSFKDLSLSDEKWVQYDLELRQISELTI